MYGRIVKKLLTVFFFFFFCFFWNCSPWWTSAFSVIILHIRLPILEASQ
jgi:hypothetical protein